MGRPPKVQEAGRISESWKAFWPRSDKANVPGEASTLMINWLCLYAGFGRNVKPSQGAIDLSEGCVVQHKDKLRTAFRPVLKR